jgi:outer membrane murein-binding lipoprotein Lpp
MENIRINFFIIYNNTLNIQNKMKKIFVIISVSLFLAGMTGCSKYDDGNLWNSVNDLEQKVKTLENKVNQINLEIGEVKELVNALNADKKITAVAETPTGYTITFNDNSKITLNHGAAGANAPVVGIDKDGDVYYWTLTTDDQITWLTDAQGNKLPVSGVTPVVGVDANGYWTVNGVQITDANGQTVKAKGEDGDSFFSSVEDGETTVTFTLTGGTTIVIPKAEGLIINLTVDDAVYFK